MFTWLKQILFERDWERRDRLQKLKGELCKPCDHLCGNKVCKRIGCLNMDMRTNFLALNDAVRQLEHYEKQLGINQEKKINTEKVVSLDDYR